MANNHAGHFHKHTDFLCEKGNLKEFHFILKSIYEGGEKGDTVSRRAVAAQAVKVFSNLNADKIRRRADILQQAGLIHKTHGRGGMRLTQEGIQYVKLAIIGR